MSTNAIQERKHRMLFCQKHRADIENKKLFMQNLDYYDIMEVMQAHLYWICALIFSLLLTLILLSDRKNPDSVSYINNSFKIMIAWVIFFCLQDSLWGMCSSHLIKSDIVFFISSEIFHVSTVITTFFWLYYILIYLGEKVRHRVTFLLLDSVVILAEFILVLVNCFKPVIFRIEYGEYITCILRPLTFFNQYIVYIIIGITTFICALKDNSKKRSRFFSVSLFTLAPIVLGVCQLIYPEGPFYSMGYFLGCFTIHIFIIAKERENIARNKVLKSLADIYYSLHIFDLENGTTERIVEPDLLSKYIGDIQDSQEMVNTVMNNTVRSNHLKMVLDFVNLTTLSDRMKGKNLISLEFIGKNHGWTRVSFISVEKNETRQKKVMLTTQIINEEKTAQIELSFQSTHDELTGLMNRRAYDSEINTYTTANLSDDFVYISMDLNSLKAVNDNLGHEAGDEIISGAAQCMKRCFGPYGNIYRVGGDEFCALLNIPEKEYEQVKAYFEEVVLSWKGNIVDSLAISSGYVRKNEVPDFTFADIASLADKRMYQSKTEYYKIKGIDRRGQRNAHDALFAFYTKILKINITDDSYQIISMDSSEQIKEMGFNKNISAWLHDFGKSGQVHPEDLESYLSKTELNYLKNFFLTGKRVFSLSYRRKVADSFKKVVMDIIPTNEYTHENQSLFLYVKSID